MFLVKISNTQNLNLKLWIKPGSISKINFTKELTKLPPMKKIIHSNIFLTILITFLQVLLK